MIRPAVSLAILVLGCGGEPPQPEPPPLPTLEEARKRALAPDRPDLVGQWWDPAWGEIVSLIENDEGARVLHGSFDGYRAMSPWDCGDACWGDAHANPATRFLGEEFWPPVAWVVRPDGKMDVHTQCGTGGRCARNRLLEPVPAHESASSAGASTR